MSYYRVKAPAWLRKIMPSGLVWRMQEDNAVYLTFDDGPHPVITPFVLDALAEYNAKATFFCIGDNVRKYPDVYNRILAEGHTVGNHTYNHLNGWKTDNEVYIDNIQQAATLIDSRIFRPPYGRIKQAQARQLQKQSKPWKIYMWDVLSGDFDINLSPEECALNVIDNITEGSIVVFHDSEKAKERMQYALNETLSYCRQRGWEMKALPK